MQETIEEVVKSVSQLVENEEEKVRSRTQTNTVFPGERNNEGQYSGDLSDEDIKIEPPFGILYDPEEKADDESESSQQHNFKPHKAPRRVLHFSDGILEEYSSEEENIEPPPKVEPSKNEEVVAWMPWIWTNIVAGASTVLNVCDAAGERLAYLFGITSPKYSLEIEEAKRIVREEHERKSMRKKAMKGWAEEEPANKYVVVEESSPRRRLEDVKT